MRIRGNILRALISLYALSALILVAAAQDDQVFIQYRQRLMESTGANMGAIGAILRSGLPFASSHVATHARAISEGSRLMGKAFEKEIAAGKTDAKPEIWKQWEQFVAAAKELELESAKLAALAETGDQQALAEQSRKLSGACRSCHQSFRKPRAESYKKQSE